MRFDSTIGETLEIFGNGIGIGGLALDERGRASLTVGETAVTFLREDNPLECLAIMVDLGPAPELTDAVGMKRLLEAGFVTWSQNWMTIGLDNGGERIVGRSSIPVASLDLHSLANHFRQMLDCARTIREADGD